MFEILKHCSYLSNIQIGQLLLTLLFSVQLKSSHFQMPRNKATEETDKLIRIAIVNSDKCKPKRCRQECKKYCPVVRMGKLCIEVLPNDKIASISEELCIGCGICVKVRFIT